MSASASVTVAPPPFQTLGERLAAASTPQRLRALLYGIWATAALLFFVGEGSLSSAYGAMKTVGKDTAPSIIAAQEIGSALADLDANAGNYLLGTRQHQIEATETFEKQRLVVTQSLVKAARNITYEAEVKPINELVEHLGRYLQHYGEVRYRKDNGDPSGAFTAYTSASEVMHKSLLPAAAVLDDVNYRALKRDYERQQERSQAADIVAGIIAAALVLLLGYAQIFLLRKMRRIVSPPLLGATLVALLFGVYLVQRISVAREDLRVAKEDAFESIHALWQARAVAYDANGDESRYLLAGLRGPTYEQAYKEKVQKLTSSPHVDEGTLSAKKLPASYKGFFADELRNVTFPGEREAALKMIRAFAVYDGIDGQIRALERSGKHNEAVQKCVGSGAGESNDAFDRFDKAILEVVSLNHKEFDTTVEAGLSTLSTASKILPIASLLIALLAFFGIRPRLREYAA